MTTFDPEPGKPVSEQQADALLEWVGSDSLDWDGLWTAEPFERSEATPEEEGKP